MDWLRENFFWLVVGALFLWMHMKMHGGHGHGGGTHGRHEDRRGGGGARGRETPPDDRDGESHAEH